MEKDLPIGFFDSGVGGLSVYSRFRELLPYEDTIYFGDLKNLPYGNKSKDELVGFAKNILDFFKSKNVKAVVIACNTSSALAYEEIKDLYDFKIYPIIQSCAEVIARMDKDNSAIKRIGIFATIGTVNSGAYKREIQRHNPNLTVMELACPNWVPIVENGLKDDDNDIESQMDKMLEFNPDKIVLGCTHYPYLLNVLENFAPKEVFIDPANIFVDYIKNDLVLSSKLTQGIEEFYVSASPELFVNNAKLFYNLKSLPKLVNF